MPDVTRARTLRRALAVAFGVPFLIVVATLAQAPPRGPDEPPDDLVARVHRAALTIDPHMDIPDDFQTPANDAGTETPGQLDLPKLERGGLDVATVALFATPRKRSRLTPSSRRFGGSFRPTPIDSSRHEAPRISSGSPRRASTPYF